MELTIEKKVNLWATVRYEGDKAVVKVHGSNPYHVDEETGHERKATRRYELTEEEAAPVTALLKDILEKHAKRLGRDVEMAGAEAYKVGKAHREIHV